METTSVTSDPRFRHLNPYPVPEETMGPSSDFDCDDDFEIEDEDIRKFYEEGKRQKVVEHDRDLALATRSNQAKARRNWDLYCTEQLKKPNQSTHLLMNPKTWLFQGFFTWWAKTHTARRLNTYTGMWEALRQVYFDMKKAVMDEDVGRSVINWLHNDFVRTHGLVRGKLHKPLMGHAGLYGLIHYMWVYDTAQFSHEWERTQLVTVILWLAFTGARPGAIVESSHTGLRGSNQAVRYRDVKLMILRPSDSIEAFLFLELILQFEKGRRNRNEPKSIFVYENRDCTLLCPVTPFLSLAMVDNAFHPRLLANGFDIRTLRDIVPEDGREVVQIAWNEEVLDKPVFRRVTTGLAGKDIDESRAWSAKSLNDYMRRTGELAGVEYPVHPYCIRREVATDLTAAGVPDTQIDHILGHRHASTRLRHYMNTRSAVDVQSIFLNVASKADLLKEVGKQCLRRGAPTELDAGQRAQLEQYPEIVAAKKERDEATVTLRSLYGFASKAPEEERAKYKSLKDTVSKLRSKKRLAMRKDMLQDFHRTADLEHVIRQPKGDSIATKDVEVPVHILEQRNELAIKFLEPFDCSQSAHIVDLLTQLNGRFEGRRARAVDNSSVTMSGPAIDRLNAQTGKEDTMDTSDIVLPTDTSCPPMESTGEGMEIDTKTAAVPEPTPSRSKLALPSQKNCDLTFLKSISFTNRDRH